MELVGADRPSLLTTPEAGEAGKDKGFRKGDGKKKEDKADSKE